ncbi:TPA: Ig-like domain-containing protein, partial [Citrobacter amalonaticus]
TLKNGANALTAASTSYAVTTDANGQVMLTATDVTAETISVSVKTSTSTQAAVTKTSTFALYPVLNAADISVPLDGAPSDAASLNTLKVIVRDLKGNPVGGQTVNWSMNSPSGKALFSPSAGTTATSISDAGGVATISLTDRRMENVTVTAGVGSGLPGQTQSGTATFMQYVNLAITGLVNDGCAVTCTVTVKVNAKDIDGNPLANLRVGSDSAAYGGGSTGFTMPTTDAAGNADVLRPMTVVAVDTGVYAFADAFHNPGVISATRSGMNVSEYRSASTTVTTVNPVSITNITTPADPYTFATSSGFPQTGFATAYFKVNLRDSNPTAYTWAVDGVNGGTSYTKVDLNGQVTLKAAKSGAQTVQVKNTATGTVLATYTFTLQGWFVNNTYMTWTNTSNYCSTRGGLATRQQLVGAAVEAGTYVSRGTVGGLWSEWGNLSKYGGSGFVASNYWSSDPFLILTGNHYMADLGYGSVTYAPDGFNFYMVCRQGL